MTRYGGIINSYQETLAELDKITGTTAPTANLSIHSCINKCSHAHVYKGIFFFIFIFFFKKRFAVHTQAS